MQTILTYTIVILALSFAIYKLFQIVIPKKKSDPGCSSGCGCDAVKLKKDILEKNVGQKKLV